MEMFDDDDFFARLEEEAAEEAAMNGLLDDNDDTRDAEAKAIFGARDAAHAKNAFKSIRSQKRRSTNRFEKKETSSDKKSDDNQINNKEIKKRDYSKDVRARVWAITQNVKHEETGEVLLSKETIIAAISHKMIKRWAYVLHDKDVYTEDDTKVAEGKANIGDKKADHWHVVIESDSPIALSAVSNWFKVEPQYVDKIKGRNGFVQFCEYLTHENQNQQKLGKHRYGDSEINASFNFRDVLDSYHDNKIRNSHKELRDQIRYNVLYEGMTIREVLNEYKDIYMEDFSYIDRCRLKYISEIAPQPQVRINYYIEGDGGIGKGLMSRAIARALIDSTGTMNDDEIYFQVGADKVVFEGYDGQPVIIWNDCRARTLLEVLGGRENVFNTFDPYPQNIRQNIKYGSVHLKNTINIVNGVEHWRTFLDTLACAYIDRKGVEHIAEDRSQSYRRFPFFLILHENDFDLMMNKGCFSGTREYMQYITYQNLRGSMKKIAQVCGENSEIGRKISAQTVEVVCNKHNVLQDSMMPKAVNEADINEIFKDYGSIGSKNIMSIDEFGLERRRVCLDKKL